MELPKQFNFRDVGGLRTKQGTFTKKGVLFRSAEPQKVGPPLFREVVSHHHVDHIIDLRTLDEVNRFERADAFVEGLHRSIPLFETIKPSWTSPKDVSPSATAERYLEMLEAGLPSVQRIIDLLVSHPQDSVLIHCAAGRDRTGIVVFTLLSLVDVESTEISLDYAKSDAAVSDGYSASPETVLELRKLIDSKYGSLVDLVTIHSSQESNIERLRDVLWEREE